MGKQILTKSQMKVMADAIRGYIEGSRTFNGKDFLHETLQKRLEWAAENFENLKPNQYDLQIAAMMRRLPYTRYEDGWERGSQLLAWDNLERIGYYYRPESKIIVEREKDLIELLSESIKE